MVHHKVQTEPDVLFPAGVGQGFQIVHSPQGGLHGAEIRNRIASVAAALGGLEQGHQMEVIHPALLQVGNFFLHAPEGPREVVHIEHHAQKVPPPVPVWVGFPAGVLLPEGLLSFLTAALQHPGKAPERLFIPVQFHIEPFQLVEVPRQTCLKSIHHCPASSGNVLDTISHSGGHAQDEIAAFRIRLFFSECKNTLKLYYFDRAFCRTGQKVLFLCFLQNKTG